MISWISKLFPPKRKTPPSSSSNHSNTIVDQQVIIKYDESLQKFCGFEIFGEVLSKEIVIYIASFLDLRSLHNFGRVNQYMIKLIFYIDENKLNNLILQREKLNDNPFSQMESRDLTIVKTEFINEYKKEEDDYFTLSQNIIWKNLVFLYFPNFVKELNIKNWMHVMRRRIIHLKCENRSIPNIGRKQPATVPPNCYNSQPPYHFIENCADIYHCRLSPSDICFRCNKEEGGRRIQSASNQCEFDEHVNNSECVYMKNKTPSVSMNMLNISH